MSAEQLATVPIHMRFGFNDARLQKKGPGFKFVKGIAVDRDPDAPKLTVGEAEFREMMESRKLGDSMTATAIGAGTRTVGGAGAGAGAGNTTLPRYVADARTVLRFETYFLEAVHESPTENARTRHITLLYYVEDDTLQLNEHKVENSGIPQGTFVKRHKCPNGDGSGDITFNDLIVGENVRMYGRTFRITSCDAATRAWYEARGIQQPADDGIPEDAYTTIRNTFKARDTGSDSEIFRGKMANPMKRFMEASLGNASNVQRCGQKDALRKFLDHDREVLRFFGVWDDRDSVYGDRLFFRLHYFLSDDTMEVLEEHKANSGRDRFPCLLKRQRIPYDIRYNDDRARGIEDDNGDSDYYNEDDLAVGTTINILGRSITIFDADDFTYKWYASHKARNMRAAAQDVSEPEPAPPVIQPPPATGFGSEEDSLSSFLFLAPKVPRPNWKQLIEFDKKILRFTARLHNASPIDKSRQFVIAYYLANDTISVYEKAQRNTGIVGGQWLSSTRASTIQVPGAGRALGKGDLFIGSVVTLKAHRFDIMSADEFSLKLMATDAKTWPLSSIENVVQDIAPKIAGQAATARATLAALDTAKAGTLPASKFAEQLVAWGVDIPQAAMVTLTRYYDSARDGNVDYNHFCDSFFGAEA